MKHVHLTLLALLVTVAALALPPLPPITGTMTVCVGSTTTLSDATTGGTWTSSSTSTATVGTSSGVVTGVTTGVVTITYFQGGSFVTANVTVNPVPPVSAGPSTVCAGSSITLSNPVGGGSWSSSNTSVATVGSSTGVITGVSAGVVTITFMLPTGCYSTNTITVNPTPAAITGTAITTVGSSTTLNCTPSGGTWSSSTPAVATVGSLSGIVYGVTAGTATITYTLPSGCYSTTVVTVNTTTHLVNAAGSASSVILLPNPARGSTWVEWSAQQPGLLTIAVSDISGRSVYATTVMLSAPDGKTSLDLSTLQPGLYFVSMHNEHINNNCKLLLQ